EALGTTDLNGGALFNAEFGIRHRGSTVPERSGVALSFCRRPGIPLEAQLENPETGQYHGYPMPDSDPFASEVISRWRSHV
ncbi:hypothetical protein R4J99_31225, partial [Pseudomonas aeruginosa]|uniref:hypothetical protein n=1 Tax=Pseudomonas aeruginosa TaxID=287 RepID=UPI00295350E0